MRALWMALALLPMTGHAYTLSTSISDSCHEVLTAQALGVLLQELQSAPMNPVPNDATLGRLLARLPGARPEQSEAERYVQLSLIVGVRAPDTEGHSTLDLNALRRVHADPDPVGQYAHGLRGPNDDGIAGDLAAVIGTRAQIRAEVEKARQAFEDGDRSFQASLYIDHYGQVPIPVIKSLYHLGRAVHALQDAHSHTLRTADTMHIVHVMNYVDAVNGHLSEGRDGMAHSDAMDHCQRDDLAPIREAVVARSVALIAASYAAVVLGDDALLEQGLSPCADNATDPTRCGWVEYLPACEAALNDAPETAEAVCCTQANDYCDNPWLPVAREDPAGPYLGCQGAPLAGPAGWGWLAGLLLLGLRRRWLLAALLALPFGVQAEAPRRAFVAAEGHFAPLSDRPDFAVLDLSFGGAVRGGYAFGAWRIVGVVDRSWFVGSEFDITVDPGVLNLGVGAEYLLFDGFIRVGLVLGTSTLLYDTLLDDAGATGPFSEVRPGGFRWQAFEGGWITFDPFTVAAVWPVVHKPRLGKLQRRTTAGFEYTF